MANLEAKFRNECGCCRKGEKEMNDRMPSSMKQEEWDYLANHLRVTTAESADRTYSISARDLVDEHKCGLYLDGLANLYRSPSRAMTLPRSPRGMRFLSFLPACMR